MKHLALKERSIDVHLVFDLPVGKVRAVLQQLEAVMIAVVVTRLETGIENAAAAVTRRTGLQLGLRIFSLQPGQSIFVIAVPKQ